MHNIDYDAKYFLPTRNQLLNYDAISISKMMFVPNIFFAVLGDLLQNMKSVIITSLEPIKLPPTHIRTIKLFRFEVEQHVSYLRTTLITTFYLYEFAKITYTRARNL
jgi:hypothetical protein